MAGITTESVLERISQGHLDCPICSNRFNNPKILECLHSFCTLCLEGLCKMHDPDSPTLVCPICRKVTRLPQGGVSALGNNFALTALVEEFNKQESLLMRVQRSKVTCGRCDTTVGVVSKCTDCHHFMCSKCTEVHKQLENTKSHTIAVVSDLMIGEDQIGKTPRLKSGDTVCEKHQDLVHFYCNTCQTLICTACTALDHRSPEHDFIDIILAEESCRHKVMGLLSQVERCKREIQDAVELTDKALSQLKATANRTVKEITDRANREVDRIRLREVLLKERVAQIDQDRSAEYEMSLVAHCAQLQRANMAVERASRLMNDGTSFELLTKQQNIVTTLTDIADRQFPPKLYELSFGSFDFLSKDVPERFGQFVVNKWKLRVEFGAEDNGTGSSTMMQEVSAFANKDLVIVDANETRVSRHDQEGQFRCYVGQSKEQSENCLNVPSSVSVSQDDQLFVVDGNLVKVFDHEQEHLYSFHPSLWDTHFESEEEAGLKSVDDGEVKMKMMAESPKESQVANETAVSLNSAADAEPQVTSEKGPDLVAEAGSELVSEVGSDAASGKRSEDQSAEASPDARSEAMGTYTPSCLATAEKLVAIGDETRKLISLHNLHGSHIRTLPADLIEGFLVIRNNKELIFTNYGRSKLVSMDLYGKKVFSIKTTNKGKLVKPTGVCCEGRSSIYVAVHLGLGRGNCEIHHFDNEGRKVGCIIQQLYNPLGLAMTPSGELAVADKNSVKIFQKVKCYTEISSLTYV